MLGGLAVVLLAGDPGRTGRQKTWLRVITGIAIAFLTRGQPDRCRRLVADILANYKVFANHPGGLLAVANNL